MTDLSVFQEMTFPEMVADIKADVGVLAENAAERIAGLEAENAKLQGELLIALKRLKYEGLELWSPWGGAGLRFLSDRIAELEGD